MAYRLFILCLTGLLIACGGSGSSNTSNNNSSEDSNAEFDFRSVTEADLEDVRETWASRDLSPAEVDILYEDVKADYTVLIFGHNVLGQRHYGAVIIPASATTDNSTPVVVMETGLQQDFPFVFVDYYLDFFQDGSSLQPFIQIIPTFRGQTLIYAGADLSTTGDFCDAWDGATDDSIATLNVAESLVPQGIYEKVLVWGGSRGGTVGLLMGIRDERVNTILAAATPVDLYRQEVMDRYGPQYVCHFIENKTPTESRRLMLASSPLFFEPHPNVENVFLYHGALDVPVPQWNINEMSDWLNSLGVNVQTFIYENQTHTSFYGTAEHEEAFDLGVAQFLDNLNSAQ